VKEYLRQLADQAENDLARGCLVREYLQARILESLQDAGVFLRWAFLGGTALRFLYSLPRFSEDLDFSLITPGQDCGVKAALTEVKRILEREGYRIEVRVSDQKTVASAFVRFPGLPYELGMSGHAEQTLAIKVEVDMNPPLGAATQTTLVRRHVTLHLCHYDKASLLAGKLHAVMSRTWTKGRDLYDLAWYLSDRTWPVPNLPLLNAALTQTGWGGGAMAEANWRSAVWQRLAIVDWDKARADVRPFLERQRDVDLVTPAVLGELLA
jgi:predicted nucleotidyltransferase component of viral defense system